MTFRTLLDALNEAYLLDSALQTPASHEHYRAKWRELVEWVAEEEKRRGEMEP